MTTQTLASSPPAAPLRDAVFSADTFDFWARKVHPLWSWQQPLAQIVAKHAESADSVTLVLKPNRHVSRFIAGQHINISVEIDGRRLSRSYSPRYQADGRIAITVKRIAGGKVSHWLCDQAKLGDTVLLTAPYGDMTLSEKPEHAVFLAAGSGITPFISLIQAHAAQGQRMSLLYWVRDESSACFADALMALAAKHANLTVQLLMTQPKAGGAVSRISAEQIQALVPELANATLYACGPAGFVGSASAIAQQLQRPFLGEAFSLPELVAGSGERVQIHLAKSRKTISVAAGEPLLSALEAAGIQPAHGCRRGICNTCACPKSSGTTRNILTQEEQHESVSGLRLCISAACSDLTIEL
ncbi:MAG: ferredoxin reductase [Pseudomonadota bacterium]